MPITVGVVENLFWGNNSYKKPNCIPLLSKSEEIQQRPIIYDFMGGRTHLYGDHWNYAIYKGVYYFLEIESCKDLEKKHYTYALVRDLWVNIISNNNIQVRGFLTTTNRDEWLAPNLNRTYPVLLQPCNVTRLSLVDEKPKLSEATVIKSTKPLSLILFDIRELRDIKQFWKVEATKYNTQLVRDKYGRGASPVFIFGELKGKKVDSIHCWKEYLRIKINEFLDDLKNPGLIISKVTGTERVGVFASADGSGRLKDHYCITWDVGGIGTGVENVILERIDLSGLEDIVHIDPKTLNQSNATKTIDESLFDDIEFHSGYESQYSWETKSIKVRKFRRKIYFPFTQNPRKFGISLSPQYKSGSYWDNEFRIDLFNWNSLSPQRVKLKGTGIGEVFLFWIDNVDFVLNYFKDAVAHTDGSGIQYFSSDGTQGSFKLSAYSDKYAEFIIGGKTESKKSLYDYFGIDKFPKNFKIPYPFQSVSKDQWRDWFFSNHLITPLGFLIFKPFHATNLDGYIWKGNSTSKIQYISGLRKSRLKKIESGQAFSEIGNLNDLPYPIWDYYNKENKNLNNTNWNRYWFNLINGLDILLQPNQWGYLYEYRTWRSQDRTSNNYSPRYLQTDSAPWLNDQAPFKNVERHKDSNFRSRRLVDWIVMKTLVNLPVTLDNGDYLFNDLEYWLDEHDTSLWTDAVNYFRWSPISSTTYPILKYLFNLEDFLEKPKEISDEEGGSVVICSTREGNIEIRQCIRFSLTHRLHGDIYSENLADTRTDMDLMEGLGDSLESKIASFEQVTNDLVREEQAVESVDGNTSRRVGYIALKKIIDGKIEDLEKPLSTTLAKKIITAFLKANGYKLSPDETGVSFFNRKHFEESYEDLFFDLKGTDWYLFIKRGKISLIAKDPSLFKPEDFKVSKLKENKELKDLSVIEKVNQKCVLNVYTQKRMLNTRFNFDNDKLNVSVKALKPVHKNSPTNYFQLNLRSDFDVIEREVLQIQKKQAVETASIMDHTLLELLRTQMRRNDRSFDILTAKDVLLATEKENEYYRRRKWDNSTERMRNWVNSALNLVETPAMGAASGMFAGGLGGDIMTSRVIKDEWNRGLGGALQHELTTQEKNISVWPTRVRTGGGILSTISNLAFNQVILDEKSKRIDTDRKYAFKDIAFRGLRIDLRHRDIQEDAIRNINKLANVYNRGVIYDIDVVEEFNKENSLSSVNLTVFTPSKEQLVLLNELKAEYGVDCDIPDAIINIREGMSEEIVRFRHLEDEGIIGLTNKKEREYLISILEMGIKVVDQCGTFIKDQRRKNEIWTCTNVYQLTKEIENQRIISGEAVKEKEKQLSAANEQLNQCNERIAELNKQLETKSNELNDLKGKCDLNKIRQEIDALKRESEARKEKVEELTQQLNDERRKFLDERDKINSLTKQLKDKTAEHDTLKNDYAAKELELEDCKRDKGSVVTSATSLEDCKAVKELFAQPTEFKFTEDDKGWTPLMYLIVELFRLRKGFETHGMTLDNWSDPQRKAMAMAWMPIYLTTLVNEFETEILRHEGFSEYNAWLLSGGDKSYSVNSVINAVNRWKQKMIPSKILELKNALDEANYMVYVTVKALHQQIGEDPDLLNFFSKFYPASSNERYKQVFGDPNIAIARKRFMDEIECSEQGNKSVSQIASEIKSSTNIDETLRSAGIDIPPVLVYPDPGLSKPSVTTPESRFARSIDEAKYSGVLLDSIEIKYPFANPLFAFEDKKITQRLENVNYRWSYDGQTLNSRPKITIAMQMFNYPYTKKANKWSELAKCVWFKWKSQGATSQDTNIKDQYGNYLRIDDLKHWEMKDQFNFLIDSVNQINIPQSMVNGLKDGSRRLRLRHGTFRLRRDYVGGKPVCYASGIANVNELIEFGNGDNKLSWPEDKIADFLKYIFIFHYLHLRPLYHDKLPSDQFHIYSFDVGQYHPARSNLRNRDLLNKINSEISKITDPTIDLQIGWLFNSFGDRLKEDGDIPVSNVPVNQQSATYLTLYRWIYGHVSGKKKYLHPYDWGQNNIYMLLYRLNEAGKAKKNKRDVEEVTLKEN